MKTTNITCDACGNELNDSGNAVDYRLALTVESMPPRLSQSSTLMHYTLPLRQDRHFCGMGCLRDWIDKGGEDGPGPQH